MNRAKFPARKDDGSFCVEIGLSVVRAGDNNLKSNIRDWIAADWMPRNLVWKREWRTGGSLGTISEQALNYQSEFMGAPEIVGYDASVLQIRVVGRESAKFWKDWLISRFLPDLKAKFPEVGDQLYIRNCEEAGGTGILP
jgi:hypothetical protein